MSTLPHITGHESSSINDTREIIDNLPISSPLRTAQNPNLNSPVPHILPQPQRSTTVRRKKPSGPNPFLETGKETDSKNEPGPRSQNWNRVQPHQPFWKFHILKFGLCLYLTTNPTLRHLYCRTAPGYFVNILKNTLGYSMVFEDIETGEPLVKVEKVSDRRSDYFKFEVKRQRCIREGHVITRDKSEKANVTPKNSEMHPKLYTKPFSPTQVPDTTVQWEEDWQGSFLETLIREPIPKCLLPIAPLMPMSNYASKMIDGQKWRVGSLPRYRESRINPHDMRYIAKRNVYFHRCFEDLERYFEWEIPPALAVYRECESASKKRAMRQFNRLLRVGSQSASKQLAPVQTEVSPFTEITSYYKCGDGVYFDKVPADDEPDHHHKLGWVTIYDDPQEFSHYGMFDLVVALTVANGYERNLAFGETDH